MPVREEQTWYHPDSGDSPVDHDWTAVGTAGTLTDDRFWTLTAAAALAYLWREAAPDDPGGSRVDDRLEIQATFQGLTNTPGTFPSTSSGHLLVLDDGERCIGLAIGETVDFVNPTDGTVYLSLGPAPFTAKGSYTLLKVDRTAWEAWLDGKLLGRLAYAAVPLGTFLAESGYAWGWFDATGSGSARWSGIETGLNRVLPPDAIVDRTRLQLPVLYQELWGDVWRAATRSFVGLMHSVGENQRRTWEQFTAGQIEYREASFTGERLPTLDGWTLTDAGSISVVRERIRIDSTTSSNVIEYVFDEPANPDDAVWHLTATWVLRHSISASPFDRVGPFMVVENGDLQIRAVMVFHEGNSNLVGWLLSDGSTSGTLGVTGEHIEYVDAFEPHTVELVVIGHDRVVLFVDGRIVDDLPYDRFGTSTTDYQVQIGRSGSAIIDCVVDVEDVTASVAYADNGLRPWFVQRLAERLVFVAGCEGNDRLDQWNRHRFGVYEVRGTERVITEIRRVACDDEAELVTTRTPGEWFLEVSYPEVTPIFLEADGFVLDTVAEYAADAPNFPPPQLQKLIETYLLPASVVEAQFYARLRTVLADNAVNSVDETTFEVESVTGFSVGDLVTLRGLVTGPVLTIDYDVGIDRTDVLARDRTGNGRHGTAVGTGALENDDGGSATADRTGIAAAGNPGTTGIRLRYATSAPSAAAGLALAGWFRWLNTASIVPLMASQDPTTTGGWRVRKLANGHIESILYSAAGVVLSTIDYTPPAITTATWTHIAVVYNASFAGAEHRLYVNGALATSAACASAPATASGGLAFGGDWSGSWLHDHRDHWVFEAELGNSDIAFLHGGTRQDYPRSRSLADTLNPWLSWLPDGYAAALCRFNPDALLPELQAVQVFDDRVWAPFRCLVDGEKRRDIKGSFSALGRSNENTNPITAGATVTVTGASAAAVGFIEIFGRQNGTLTPRRERLQVNGTTPVVGTVQWAADGVFGVLMDRQAGANVVVTDTSDGDTLYTVSGGTRGKGVEVFDPPLRCLRNGGLRYDADAATTDPFLVVGHNTDTGLEEVLYYTLNGTTETETDEHFTSIRVIATGNVSNARTVTYECGFVDLGGTLEVVSNNAADVGLGLWVVGADLLGAPKIASLTLNGTTPVEGPADWSAIFGVVLAANSAGTITVRLFDGSVDVTVCAFNGALQDCAGGRKLKADIDGQVVATLQARDADISDPLTRIVYLGIDTDGAIAADILEMRTGSPTPSSVSWQRLMAVLTSDVHTETWVTTRGVAWRADGAYEAANELSQHYGWSGSLANETDARLDDMTRTDVSEFVPVDLDGVGSNSEDTVISAIDTETKEVTVPLVSGTFVTGDIMRHRL